ncbi:MAG: Mur ligase domain-containing protein, partial [Nitrospinota bacterium]
MMPRFTMDELAAATGGIILRRGRRKTVEGVFIDSRRVAPGALFVPIVGRRHDAHAFIPQALKRGAAAVLAERDRLPARVLEAAGDAWVIGVKDSTHALGELAAHHRRRFDIPLVAVT